MGAVHQFKAVQFVRPHGVQQLVLFQFEAEPETVAAYREMTGRGCRFEVEVLGTGEVSIAIARRGPDAEDLESEIVSNDADSVHGALVSLLGTRCWASDDWGGDFLDGFFRRLEE